MSRKRRGLVLGGGGVLGAAWTIGALCALEEERGFSCTDVDAIIGTSAGSVVACLLAAGISPWEQYTHQHGDGQGRLAEVELDYRFNGVKARPPSLAIGSPRLVAAYLRGRGRLGTPALVAGLMPRGRGSLGEVIGWVDKLLPTWPSAMDLRIVAVEFTTGRRHAFGGETSAPPSTAMAASCAMPSVFAPVEVDGSTYVDGGARSMASADLLAGKELDEVYILAPLAHLVRDPSAWTVGRFLLRRWRRPQTVRLQREMRLLSDEGAQVTLLAPAAEDLGALGLNPMDPMRRLSVLETSLRTTREALRKG
jgi:NTE family protein